MIEVKIVDDPYNLRDGIAVHQYQAYCVNCHTHLQGPTGIGTWQSKSPAVKAAKAHIERHPYIESLLERRAANGDLRIVQTITA